MKPLIVIQARLGSTRLPNKVLLPLGGKPVLQWVVERCRKNGAEVVVAAPFELDADGEWAIPYAEWMGEEGLFRDTRFNNDDVLARYSLCAALRPSVTHILRVTADCPFLDHILLAHVIHALDRGHDYAGNTMERTFPRGLDVEGFSVELLREAHESASDPYDREHVTPWMQRHCVNPFHVKQTVDQSQYRWCLDTPQDYAWMQGVVQKYPNPTTAQLLAYRPERFDG